jgi:hypothetical protein
MMKVNKWTLGLAAVGLVTLPAVIQAEEKMSAVQTALSTTSFSGYVNTSAQYNIGHTAGGPNGVPGFAFNNANKADGFNLNVVNLVIEKPLDAHDNWAAGYKIDMIYGPDAVGWNTSPGAGASDFALKQAYVALRIPVLQNGVDVKMGTFDTILGYETFNAGSNPNFTRSWGYTIEPTQHTGLLAAYQVCKEFGFAVGVANTWTPGINQRSWLAAPARSETDKTYMGAITLTAPESWGWVGGSTLYGAVVSGFGGNIKNTGANDSLLSLYAGLTMNTPVKALKVGFAYDHVSNNNGLGNNIGAQYTANAAALYASFQATEKLSFHGRAEYVWSNLPGAITPGTGGSCEMLALTATVQYNLWANVISRLEFRWDKDLQDGGGFERAQDSSFMIAANLIYKF